MLNVSELQLSDISALLLLHASTNCNSLLLVVCQPVKISLEPTESGEERVLSSPGIGAIENGLCSC